MSFTTLLNIVFSVERDNSSIDDGAISLSNDDDFVTARGNNFTNICDIADDNSGCVISSFKYSS